jgi:AmmeMemoRadiSam system protein B
MKPTESYREPAVAGRFYPGDPEVLASAVDRYLEGATTLPQPGPSGLICPHAGYDYSGSTAAFAYREIRGRRYEAVIVVGPSHYDRFPGASVWPGAGYRTPLGLATHPEEILRRLEAASAVQRGALGHREEHSVEVQIPFVQRVAAEIPVLPVVLADDRPRTCRELGQALAEAVGARHVLFVASSDLYHGHSNAECERRDATTLAALERNDRNDLEEGFRDNRYQACGRGPILAVLEACRRLGSERVTLLASTNSDTVTGREGGYVVGYAALAITQDLR